MNRLFKIAALLAFAASLVALAFYGANTRFVLLAISPIAIPILCEMACELYAEAKS